jgi:hypothetical protein
MASASKINFDELIPEMIKRLKSEHRKFESDFVKVKTSIEDNNVILASEIIQSISDEIIHHAVEEEARLMRVIMHKAKEESAESIKIIQEHNWVMNFLKNRIITIARYLHLHGTTEVEKQSVTDQVEYGATIDDPMQLHTIL